MSLSWVLFLIFLVLKLVGLIGWSWWWVTSPLWIGFILSFIAHLLLAIFESPQDRARRRARVALRNYARQQARR